MTEQELRLIDDAYSQYVDEIKVGMYEIAEESLLKKLAGIDAPSSISYKKFLEAQIYVERHLFVYFMRAGIDEFLKEFPHYIEHNYGEFVAMTFSALYRRGVINSSLLEKACGIVLEHGRSDRCYMYCRSMFKQFEKYAPNFIFGPNANRLKQKAISIQFGRG